MKSHASINWESAHQRLRTSERAIAESSHPSDQALRQVLDSRARILARPREAAEDRSRMITLLAFRVGDGRFAIDAQHILEVGPLRHCTPVPGAAAELSGVMCHRGEVRSVIHLSRVLGHHATAPSLGGCFIHVRTGWMQTLLRVDSVDQILSVRSTDLVVPEAGQGVSFGRFATAMHRDGTVVLSAVALCTATVAGHGSHQHMPPSTQVSGGGEAPSAHQSHEHRN